MRLAHPPAVEDHLVPGLEFQAVGGGHHAGEVDARDHREAAHHRQLAGDGQPVLVVDGGVRDPHQNVAVHEVADGEIANADALLLLGVAIDDQRLEFLRSGHPDSYSGIRWHV
jgi:hypothetical protein